MTPETNKAYVEWGLDHWGVPGCEITEEDCASAFATGVEWGKQAKPQIGVTVAVALVKDGKVLLGRRKSGKRYWAFPGGKIKVGEMFMQAIQRELREETGVDVSWVRFITAWEDIRLDNEERNAKHNVLLFFRAKVYSGEPQNLEPDKCEGWGWYSQDELDGLPGEIFPPLASLLRNEWGRVTEEEEP